MKKRFCELAVGARFEFRGRRYEKMTPEVGRDEERGGNLFWAETEVVASGPQNTRMDADLEDGGEGSGDR